MNTKLPLCPICYSHVEEHDGNVRCDYCPFWATTHHLKILAKMAAKAKVLDKVFSKSNMVISAVGLAEGEAVDLDAELAIQLKKIGL